MPAKQNNMFFYKIIMKQNAMKIQSNNKKKHINYCCVMYLSTFYTKGVIKPCNNNSILIIK